MLNLAAALRARGHAVVFGTDAPAEIDIAINDARLLPGGPARQVVWFHNEVTFWREARRGRLPALWRHRPAAVFCGAEQARAHLPFSSRATLPHGLPPTILSAPPAEAPPGPCALFISQAYRGLADMIGLWRTRIAPALPGARFVAHIAPADMPRYRALAAKTPSIAILPRVENAEMPGLLRGARLVFAPGHRAETFCLAAAEAIAMGVPVLTYGIGALKHRVRHGQTGFICRSPAEMATHAKTLLTSDALWRHMQAHGLGTRENAGWDRIAEQWERFLDAKT